MSEQERANMNQRKILKQEATIAALRAELESMTTCYKSAHSNFMAIAAERDRYRQANEIAGAGAKDRRNRTCEACDAEPYENCKGDDPGLCPDPFPESRKPEAPRSTTCRDCGHDVREHYSGGMPHCNRCACPAYVGGEEGT